VDACGGVAIGGHTDGDLAGTPRGGRDSILVVTRLAVQSLAGPSMGPSTSVRPADVVPSRGCGALDC
jgi:hypothetical protein